jgi:hypothetical protein
MKAHLAFMRIVGAHRGPRFAHRRQGATVRYKPITASAYRAAITTWRLFGSVALRVDSWVWAFAAGYAKELVVVFARAGRVPFHFHLKQWALSGRK